MGWIRQVYGKEISWEETAKALEKFQCSVNCTTKGAHQNVLIDNTTRVLQREGEQVIKLL